MTISNLFRPQEASGTPHPASLAVSTGCGEIIHRTLHGNWPFSVEARPRAKTAVKSAKNGGTPLDLRLRVSDKTTRAGGGGALIPLWDHSPQRCPLAVDFARKFLLRAPGFVHTSFTGLRNGTEHRLATPEVGGPNPPGAFRPPEGQFYTENGHFPSPQQRPGLWISHRSSRSERPDSSIRRPPDLRTYVLSCLPKRRSPQFTKLAFLGDESASDGRFTRSSMVPNGQAVAPLPPQNLDAEESVLGAMMLSESAIEAASGALDAGDFYRESHSRIYRAALELYRPAFSRIYDHGRKQGARQAGRARRIGNESASTSWLRLSRRASDAGRCAKIVPKMAALHWQPPRPSANTPDPAPQLGAPGRDPELVDRARQMVFDLAQHRIRGSFEPSGSLVREKQQTDPRYLQSRAAR